MLGYVKSLQHVFPLGFSLCRHNYGTCKSSQSEIPEEFCGTFSVFGTQTSEIKLGDTSDSRLADVTVPCRAVANEWDLESHANAK